MTVEQEKSDREFERQALYNQYIAYSKAASRAFWILLAVSVYLGYAYLDRSSQYLEDVAAWEECVLEAKLDYFSPHNQPICPVPVGEIPEFETRFEKNYTLPVVNLSVPGVIYLAAGPIIMILITIVYWSYLRGSRVAQSRLVVLRGAPSEAALYNHPWLYNLPFGSASFRALWQIAMEVAPVMFFASVMALAVVGIGWQAVSVVTGGFVTLACISLHSNFFGVRIVTYPVILALFPIATAVLVSIKGIPSVMGVGYSDPRVLLLAFSIAILLVGTMFIKGHSLIGYVSLPFITAMWLVTLFTREGRADRLDGWRWIVSMAREKPKLGGYITYYRLRREELREREATIENNSSGRSEG